MYQNRFIPYARQSISQEDIDAVSEAMRQDLITRGPKVRAFEEALAQFCGARFAVCMSSGTAALYAAFQAASVCPDDRFLTTPNSFIATCAAGMRLGARPYFIDIDRTSGNMSLDRLQEALTVPYSRGRFVICPVHFAGIAVDMKRLDSMLKTPDVVIIEDAAHAIGSYYPSGEKVGSCAFGHMTVFSFHAIKTMTCGEGGCVTTNDEALYHRLLRLRDSGIERSSEPYYYEVRELSSNPYMTEMQAALGLSQLSRLEQFVEKRRRIMSWYRARLAGRAHVRLFDACHDPRTAYHLACVQLDFDALKTTKKRVYQALIDEQIQTQYHYIPLYRHPLLVSQYGEQHEQFSEMERYYAQEVSLPLFFDLEESDVDRICEALKRAV